MIIDEATILPKIIFLCHCLILILSTFTKQLTKRRDMTFNIEAILLFFSVMPRSLLANIIHQLCRACRQEKKFRAPFDFCMYSKYCTSFSRVTVNVVIVGLLF